MKEIAIFNTEKPGRWWFRRQDPEDLWIIHLEKGQNSRPADSACAMHGRYIEQTSAFGHRLHQPDHHEWMLEQAGRNRL